MSPPSSTSCEYVLPSPRCSLPAYQKSIPQEEEPLPFSFPLYIFQWIRHPSRQWDTCFQCLPYLPLFKNFAYTSLTPGLFLVCFSSVELASLIQKKVEGSQDWKENRHGPCYQVTYHLWQDKEYLCIFASYAVARHLSTQPTLGWVPSWGIYSPLAFHPTKQQGNLTQPQLLHHSCM